MSKDLVLDDLFPAAPTCIRSTVVPSYLEGRLADEEGRAFESHLEDCEFCRQEVRELRVLMGLDERTAMPPRGQVDWILDRVGARLSSSSGKRRKLWMSGLALAATIACLFVGITLYQFVFKGPAGTQPGMPFPGPVSRGAMELKATWAGGDLEAVLPGTPVRDVRFRITGPDGAQLWSETVKPSDLELDGGRVVIKTEGLKTLPPGAKLDIELDGGRWSVPIEQRTEQKKEESRPEPELESSPENPKGEELK